MVILANDLCQPSVVCITLVYVSKYDGNLCRTCEGYLCLLTMYIVCNLHGAINLGTKVYIINRLLGPFISTNVKSKKRPAITTSASYSMGSCPLAPVIAFPNCTLFR